MENKLLLVGIVSVATLNLAEINETEPFVHNIVSCDDGTCIASMNCCLMIIIMSATSFKQEPRAPVCDENRITDTGNS